MDREKLEAYLSEGLSLEQIGKRVGRHPSTVSYWLEKHGLTANGHAAHAPRGGLTREQLEPLVDQGMTLVEMSVELERGISTIRYWLTRFNLVRSRRPTRISSAEDVLALDAEF